MVAATDERFNDPESLDSAAVTLLDALEQFEVDGDLFDNRKRLEQVGGLYSTEIENRTSGSEFLLWVFRLLPFKHLAVSEADVIHYDHEAQDNRCEFRV